MKILTLTDHKSFEEYNSIYKMMYWLNDHSDVDLYIASRADEKNRKFFFESKISNINAKHYDKNFIYRDIDQWFLDSEEIELSEFEGIFLRLDQPLDESFLKDIHKLEKDLLIINSPKSLLKTGSKEYLLNFPGFIPGIKNISTIEEVKELSKEKNIVLKPYMGYGGNGLIKIVDEQLYFENEAPVGIDSEEAVNHIEKVIPCISMDYMQNITNGDKRIIVFNSQVIGQMLRIPADNNWLANVAQGATTHSTDITEEERKIVDCVSKDLLEQGVYFFGIDTLENDNGVRVLSEIDPVNPGGLISIEKFKNKNVIKPLMHDIAELYLNQKSSNIVPRP